MFDLNEILNVQPFSLRQKERQSIQTNALASLTEYHYERCVEYRRILDALGYKPGSIKNNEDVPFVPVRLFKEYQLQSVPSSEVVKTMTSSGTTGQSVSKIFLDKQTAANQTKVLTKIVSSFMGSKRLPMLVLDSKRVIKDRNLFSARGAGILGFSMFGHDVTYALDDDMRLDQKSLQSFFERHPAEPILLFGFTFMIWEHFYKELVKSGTKFALKNAVFIHGGGWKKLAEEAVSHDDFKRCLCDVLGECHIYNYYGMVEQTGSVFMECEHGHLHASIFSDIVIRNHRDFSPQSFQEQGLVQVMSLLPLSYPGHSILTEDVGAILGVDDCACGRQGKYFRIDGRIKNAEARGCSDTYIAGK